MACTQLGQVIKEIDSSEDPRELLNRMCVVNYTLASVLRVLWCRMESDPDFNGFVMRIVSEVSGLL